MIEEDEPLFKGQDFMELANHWGLRTKEDHEQLAEYIIGHYDWDEEVLDDDIKGDMINFLFALKHEEHSSDALVAFCDFLLMLSSWEDDWPFVNYFTHNIEMLWN